MNTFGREDLSFIGEKHGDAWNYTVDDEIIQRGTRGLCHLLQLCHFDARAPQNANVAYDGTHVYLFEGTWKRYHVLVGVQKILDNVLRHVYEYIDHNIGVPGMYDQQEVEDFVRTVACPANQCWQSLTWIDMEDPTLNPLFYGRIRDWPKEVQERRSVLIDIVLQTMLENKKFIPDVPTKKEKPKTRRSRKIKQ